MKPRTRRAGHDGAKFIQDYATGPPKKFDPDAARRSYVASFLCTERILSGDPTLAPIIRQLEDWLAAQEATQ